MVAKRVNRPNEHIASLFIRFVHFKLNFCNNWSDTRPTESKSLFVIQLRGNNLRRIVYAVFTVASIGHLPYSYVVNCQGRIQGGRKGPPPEIWNNYHFRLNNFHFLPEKKLILIVLAPRKKILDTLL